MKRVISTLAALALMVSACASATQPSDMPVSYPNVSYPNSEETPPTQPDYAPKPEDAALMRGLAYVEGSDLLTLESYPLQFVLQLRGSLPTPCNALRVVVSPPDAENKLLVDVYSVVDSTKVCAQSLQPFEVSIALGSFPAGTYTLWINGKQVAEFQS